MPYWNKPRKKWIGQVVFEGKKYQSQHETEQAARRWELRKKTILEIESGTILPTGTVSLTDLAEKYLDYADSKFTRKTYNEKKLAFRMLFRSVNSDLDVALLHQGIVLDHLSRQHEERSGCSANKDRKNLIAAWNWAVRYIPEFPESNPFMTDRFPEKHSPRQVPSEEDFRKVHDVAESEQDALMLLCYLHLAARKTEIFQLRTEDVDLAHRRISLATRKRKDGSLHYDSLPMTDRLHREFSRYIPSVSGHWMFPNPVTGLPYVSRQRWLSGLCCRAGVKEFGLHGIRHLSASILINARVSLLDVQAILRHKNLTTTQRYVHRLESVRKAVKVFT